MTRNALRFEQRLHVLDELRVVVRADEADHQQPPSHILRGLGEVGSAAALQISQLHWLAHHKS